MANCAGGPLGEPSTQCSRLAVIDAGLGGLTVLARLVKKRTDLDIVYLGDCANMPYNVHDDEWILGRAQKLIDYLKSYCNPIIIGCNTIATVRDRLHSAGELISIVDPALKALRQIRSFDTRIIIGSKTTVFSRMYEANLGDVEVVRIPCTYLATTIERYGPQSTEVTQCINQEVTPALVGGTRKKIALVLACTHFPLVLDSIVQAVESRLAPILLHVLDLGEILVNDIDLGRFPQGKGSVTILIHDRATTTKKALIERLLETLEISVQRLTFIDLNPALR